MHQPNPKSIEREFLFSDADFRFLAELANKRTGIVLAEHKKDMVYSRLARRLRALGLDNFTDYCQFLQADSGADEIGHLVNAITTNLTSFFREAHHFEHLRESVIKPFLQQKHSKRFRLWSSACSSGMEPYSIAMVLKDAVRDLAAWDMRILATDIDSNMLGVGKAGEYNASEYEHIPAAYRSCIEQGPKSETIRMAEGLKQLIAFRHLNLLEAWPMKGKFDVIFCRNVVIYFDKPTKQRLFARMADMLNPGGWLYIGHSESLHNLSDRFESAGRTIYRKVK